MSRVLIVSSQIHKTLAEKQLKSCVKIFTNSPYEYHIERLNAGTYEIPFVINTYAQYQPFDAYLALGLVLKTSHDHYDYIMSHIKECFTRFACNNIIVGNAIVTGSTIEELAAKIESSDPCIGAYQSAYNAIDTLINIKNRINSLS